MRFFHAQVPVYSICLYRAAVGTLIFAEALTWLGHTTELFSNSGFQIPQVAWVPVFNPTIAFLIGLALVISSLMMALGLFTRSAIITTLVLWSYTYAIDSISEKAAQTIVIVVLVILSFSNSGARFSLDHWWRRKSGREVEPSTNSVFLQRLIQIEFAQIYFFSGVSKMFNPDWVNGSTFYRLMNCRWATDLGLFISTLKLDIPARMGGLGTILFELFAGVFLFIPATRPYAIAVAVMFHLGIQTTLWIGTLGAHFILALLFLFPDPETIAQWVRKFSRSPL